MKKVRNTQSITTLKKHADRYFSKAIRYRDGRKVASGWIVECITCSTWKPFSAMQAGHFQSRRHNSTRFDDENVNAQCQKCNLWGAGEQYKYALALDEKYGEGTARKLSRKAQELHSFTSAELLQIIADAKSEIAFYEGQS